MTRVKGQYLILIAILAVLLAGCQAGPNKPGRIFMPDMYYSNAYDTYTKNPNFADSMTARTPAEGTIARGMLPESSDIVLDSFSHKSFLLQRYYNNSPEDYIRAGLELENPVALTKDIEKLGKQVYTISCAVCHGVNGEGDGTIVQTEAYPPVPKYADRLPTINEGNMYHAITYGKNLMGGYSADLTPVERWAVIYYIQKMAKVGPYVEIETPAVEDNAEISAEGNNTSVEQDSTAVN